MKAALKSEFVIFGTFMPAFAVILVPCCAIMALAMYGQLHFGGRLRERHGSYDSHVFTHLVR